ncbi:MAG: dienelactone hydrolase family protein [Arenimonas sp.]
MRILLALSLFFISTVSMAAQRADKISWTHGSKNFEGYLVWDDTSKKLRPGLLMVPNWYGITDSAIRKAKTIAGKDYVILLVDMYGRDVRPKNPEEAGKAATEVYAAPAELRGRIKTALAQLKASGKKAPIDSKNIGAIGFCFGGAVALDLARSGADIAGVASFHGNLSSKLPATKAGDVKTAVLVMNGADDKYVPAESIIAFQKEMQDTKADWQFVNFGGAVHCFAEPDETGTVPGCLYHEPSYKRSMKMMRNFFTEKFVATK